MPLKDLIVSWCSGNGFALYAALAVLPGFGFPASVLLIAVGVAWGASAQTCLTALSALVLNLLWTRWLAAGPGKRVIRRLLGKHWDRIADLPQTDILRLICILRITPGVPLFAQNYILGVLGAPLGRYLLISVPLTSLWVVGFVVTGGSVFRGSTGAAITGVSILVAASLLLRLIRQRLRATTAPVE